MFWNKKIKEVHLDSAMIELGREIERGLFSWKSLIWHHWEEMDGNLYHKNVNLMVRKILDDKTLSDIERVNKANELIKFSRNYRNKINKVSESYKKFTETRLAQFEEMLEQLSKIKPYNEEKEWVKLSWNLCKILEQQMVVTNGHMDTDEVVPNFVIKGNGKDPNRSMTNEEMNSFKEKLLTVHPFKVALDSEENKIEPLRSKIAENMFGKLASYCKEGSYSRLVNEIKN